MICRARTRDPEAVEGKAGAGLRKSSRGEGCSINEVQRVGKEIVENVERVIFGKRDVLELVLIALFCEGHLLVEDVPGVGKTMLARAVAGSIGSGFKRIQFTPDLLPSDIVGVSIYNEKTGEFEFRPGPVISEIVLADEINRATPRTQSALLEAMGEKQVTVDGVTRKMPRPFLVLATQNPVEQEGTFPLPEAQLDRFLMKINMGYPSFEEENRIVLSQQFQHPIEGIEPVTDGSRLMGLQKEVQEALVEDSVREYLIKIVRATRSHRDVLLGASPRGALALFKTAQARAALHGRSFVLPDDGKSLAKPVLGHRLILKPESALRGTTTQKVIEDIIGGIEVPIMHESGGQGETRSA